MTHRIVIALVLSSITMPMSTPAEGVYRATLTDSGGAVVGQQDSADPAFTFTGVAEGAYTVTAMRLDVDGNTLGTPIVQDITVSPDTRQIDLPSMMTITVTSE